MPHDRSSDFAALASELHAEADQDLIAQAIVTRIREFIREADDVSLTVRSKQKLQTLASSSPLAEKADATQSTLGEGPTVTAANGTRWVRSGDVGLDPRWPEWAAAGRELGVGSLLSVQLRAHDRPIGALSLYSPQTGRFGEQDTIDVAVVYATHAASALSIARLVSGLRTALSSRHAIGMAQGIVMERYGLNEHTSFDLLRRLSTTRNERLREVANHIVKTRDLPEAPHPAL